MKIVLNLIIKIFDLLHVYFIEIFQISGVMISDKQQHFLILGVIFLFMFIFIEMIFKKIAKLSVSIIAFIYVFTVSVVVALAIEIGQWKNQSGEMDFNDVTWGLYGVVVFTLAFVIIRWVLVQIYKWVVKNRGNHTS